MPESALHLISCAAKPAPPADVDRWDGCDLRQRGQSALARGSWALPYAERIFDDLRVGGGKSAGEQALFLAKENFDGP